LSQNYKSVLIEYSKKENIPSEWNIQKIKEICQITSGNGFPLEYQKGNVGEIPFIKVSDLNIPENSIYVSVANNSIDKQTAHLIRAKICPKKNNNFSKSR